MTLIPIKRTEFPAKVKLAMWQRCQKLDGKPRCEKCGALLTAANPVEYDHIIELWEGGTSTADNGHATGKKCCHKPKTAAATERRAKADRIARKEAKIKTRRPFPKRADPWGKRHAS